MPSEVLKLVGFACPQNRKILMVVFDEKRSPNSKV